MTIQIGELQVKIGELESLFPNFATDKRGKEMKKKLYIETYGCQMNVVDSEVVVAILQQQDYEVTETMEEADLVLVNTCSIRDNAEQRVRSRIAEFGARKKQNRGLRVGVIGCMAERLKDKLLEEERSVDLVVGPDAYRELPGLLEEVEGGQRGVNTLLSMEETYADVSPVRLDKNRVSSFVSIMRGCNNFCAYCVVPYTRGRERSRDPETIVKEVRELFEAGYREVTLLGQNVNSYRFVPEGGSRQAAGESGQVSAENNQAPGNIRQSSAGGAQPEDGSQASSAGAERKAARSEREAAGVERKAAGVEQEAVVFESLLERVAGISPELRVRFATSHPKDMSDALLMAMARHPNLCRSIHLPVQSGSTAVLGRMKRGYTRESYLERIAAIRKYLPGATISTDIIAGFCGENEVEHEETLSLMEAVGYDFAYMFKYSERPDTLAAKRYADDVPDAVKTRRLNEIIAVQNRLSLESKQRDLGRTVEVLVEGTSKKSDTEMFGRTSQNKVVVFPGQVATGSYISVKINDCTSATLLGTPVK